MGGVYYFSDLGEVGFFLNKKYATPPMIIAIVVPIAMVDSYMI